MQGQIFVNIPETNSVGCIDDGSFRQNFMDIVSSLPTALDVCKFGRAEGMSRLQQKIDGNTIDMSDVTSVFAKSSSNHSALTQFMLRNDWLDVESLEFEYSSSFINAGEVLVQKTYSLPKDPSNTLALLMMDVVPSPSFSVTLSASSLSHGEDRSLVIRTQANDFILGGFPSHYNLKKLVIANKWASRKFMTYVLSLDVSGGIPSFHLHNLKIPGDLNDEVVVPGFHFAENRFALLQDIEPQGIIPSFHIILDTFMTEIEPSLFNVEDAPQGTVHCLLIILDIVMTELEPSVINVEDEPRGIVHSLLIIPDILMTEIEPSFMNIDVAKFVTIVAAGNEASSNAFDLKSKPTTGIQAIVNFEKDSAEEAFLDERRLAEMQSIRTCQFAYATFSTAIQFVKYALIEFDEMSDAEKAKEHRILCDNSSTTKHEVQLY